MEVIGIICMLSALAQPLIFIVGMIKPQYVLPIRKIKRKRLAIFGISSFLFFVLAIIAGNTLPDIPQDNMHLVSKTNMEHQQSSDEKTGSFDTIFVAPCVVDSILAYSYKEKFDSLYNKLIGIDNLDAKYHSRSSVHKEIQRFLFDDWWNLMERIDSTRQILPLSRKEYEKSCRKYDKQYARFTLYGDEDTESVKFWAKSEAERILSKLAVDPESLVVEKVSCNGKTTKGYKCTVVYRAKNGFGGYVREYITLIMVYNMENSLYECVEVM